MAIITDASSTATWHFRDRLGTAEADEVLARVHNEPAIVPDLFWHETRNVLVVAERKGRIDANTAETHLNRLRNLPLITDHNQNDAETIALARQHNLSGYDAAYLETAHRRQARLATLDKNYPTPPPKLFEIQRLVSLGPTYTTYNGSSALIGQEK